METQMGKQTNRNGTWEFIGMCRFRDDGLRRLS